MLHTRQKIALARLCSLPIVRARRALGLSAEVRVRRGGFRWRLDLEEGIDFSIWLLGGFERRVARAMRRLVRPGATVLDIGANVGAHTLTLARLAGPGGRVIAVEPTDWAFAKLTNNVALNPVLEPRIALRQAFLLGGDQDALPPTVCSSWPLSASADVHPQLGGQPKATSAAQAASLDTLLAREGVDRVDFVKLDVDGYEGQVLRGAGRMLKKLRPTMLVELAPYLLVERGESVDAVLRLLTEAGYALSTLTSDAPLGADDIRRLLAGAEATNFVARAA